MKLVGKYSIASALRWFLGFINVFVMIGTVLMGGLVVASLFVPDFASGFMDGLNDERVNAGGPLAVVERLTVLGAFLACGFTWWVINRLRAILLSVNRGDAFERANVKRLRAIGFGLLGIQVTAILLSVVAPLSIGDSASDYDIGLGSWLGILVVFILAEVFRQGSAMRDEQMTTV
ncbi:DUF2975 domain-containing protein [Brevundimonas sp.]|jgi:hypothetical protein|uniref:DUF2975 domain-containing protein n=1 Tax=Brevundimonas sp. TaxID=1871086 RepID=UPI00179EE8E5|nr:DUF2975 domain-containing protein [Brevundimonas sp.]MBA4808131.1 DUF2975 domain-containing protein [Brevundimonas sp.]